MTAPVLVDDDLTAAWEAYERANLRARRNYQDRHSTWQCRGCERAFDVYRDRVDHEHAEHPGRS